MAAGGLPGAIAWLLRTLAAALDTAPPAGALAHPPVLIVPGFMGPRFLLWPLATSLRASGRRVEILDTFPALGGIEHHARRVAAAIEQLRAETGAERVDYVAHSMGGLAARWYIRHLAGATRIRRLVTIATPHHGTAWARLRITRSARDMLPGGEVLVALREGEGLEGVRCTNIRGGWDQMVWPREHGVWGDHAHDHELPFAEHWAIQLDPRALALVHQALDAPDDAPGLTGTPLNAPDAPDPADTPPAAPDGPDPADTPPAAPDGASGPSGASSPGTA